MTLKHFSAVAFSLLLATPLLSAAPAKTSPSNNQILPLPQQIQIGEGTFKVDKNLTFGCSAPLKNQINFLASQLRNATGWKIPVTSKGAVQFAIDKQLPKEGYQLKVSKTGAQITGGDYSGLFYGFQSLRQLMPAEAFQKKGSVSATWSIPTVNIQDAPAFPWRGIHIDVARFFQTKQAMLDIIDALALNKINILHWHLTDNNAWRIQIKAYPKLTTVQRNKEAFYSQKDVRDIVNYALVRGVQIVPEIDVPGHSNAAVKAYPFLGCQSKDKKGKVRISGVYNPAKETTYQFIDTVFSELNQLFPKTAYYHFGADEVGMGAWRSDPDCLKLMKEKKLKKPQQLMDIFVTRVSAIIKKHHRKTIAWDEALSHAAGNVAKNDIVLMSWRGMKPGIQALKDGYQVIFCPVSTLYFDRANSRSAANPTAYSANTVNLHRVYHFQATPPYLTPDEKKRVLGAEGCVWGEKIKSRDHVLRQAMLRGSALSEALWTNAKTRDWNGFLARLEQQRKRMDVMNLPYFWEPETTAIKVADFNIKSSSKEKTTFSWDVSKFITKNGLYEFTFEYLSGDGSFSIYGATLDQDGKEIAKDPHGFLATFEGRGVDQLYQIKVTNYKKGATYKLNARLSPYKGSAQGGVFLVPPCEKYSKQGTPNGKGNVSGRKQPDEI